MSFQAKDSLVLSRQLQAQSLSAMADLVAGSSDLPHCISIDNDDIEAVEIVIDVKESVEKCFKAQIVDRSSGQPVALDAAPAVDGSEITLVLDGTGLADVCIELSYQVAE